MFHFKIAFRMKFPSLGSSPHVQVLALNTKSTEYVEMFILNILTEWFRKGTEKCCTHLSTFSSQRRVRSHSMMSHIFRFSFDGNPSHFQSPKKTISEKSVWCVKVLMMLLGGWSVLKWCCRAPEVLYLYPSGQSTSPVLWCCLRKRVVPAQSPQPLIMNLWNNSFNCWLHFITLCSHSSGFLLCRTIRHSPTGQALQITSA